MLDAGRASSLQGTASFTAGDAGASGDVCRIGKGKTDACRKRAPGNALEILKALIFKAFRPPFPEGRGKPLHPWQTGVEKRYWPICYTGRLLETAISLQYNNLVQMRLLAEALDGPVGLSGLWRVKEMALPELLCDSGERM